MARYIRDITNPLLTSMIDIAVLKALVQTSQKKIDVSETSMF